jgi:hypothetical protein
MPVETDGPVARWVFPFHAISLPFPYGRAGGIGHGPGELYGLMLDYPRKD